MTSSKIALCQIPLTFRIGSSTIYNTNEHMQIIEKCLRFASEKDVDYVVFPEYSYFKELESLYKDLSRSLTIVGGSYLSQELYNETVVAYQGNIFTYKKINLSPNEHSVLNPINSGIQNPLYLYTQHGVMSILTCFDYLRLSRNVALQTTIEGDMVDIIFSPSCNDKPTMFFEEANATHHQRDEFYSIICNVSAVNFTDGNRIETSPQYGCSCIFGLYDPESRNQIIARNWCDDKYGNLILSLPAGEVIGIVTLEIPYVQHRRRAIEYRPNPSMVELFQVSDLSKI